LAQILSVDKLLSLQR